MPVKSQQCKSANTMTQYCTAFSAAPTASNKLQGTEHSCQCQHTSLNTSPDDCEHFEPNNKNKWWTVKVTLHCVMNRHCTDRDRKTTQVHPGKIAGHSRRSSTGMDKTVVTTTRVARLYKRRGTVVAKKERRRMWFSSFAQHRCSKKYLEQQQESQDKNRHSKWQQNKDSAMLLKSNTHGPLG